MVQIEFLPGKLLAAVLTGTVVPCINVKAAKADLSFRDPVVTNEKDDPWNLNGSVYSSDGVLMDGNGEIGPTLKIECLILLVYGTSQPLIKE